MAPTATGAEALGLEAVMVEGRLQLQPNIQAGFVVVESNYHDATFNSYNGYFCNYTFGSTHTTRAGQCKDIISLS